MYRSLIFDMLHIIAYVDLSNRYLSISRLSSSTLPLPEQLA